VQTVRSVMSAPLTTVERHGHVAATAYLMKRANQSALIVVSDDGRQQSLGIITQGDISDAVADGGN
jgi:predicted transcriptional regulator